MVNDSSLAQRFYLSNPDNTSAQQSRYAMLSSFLKQDSENVNLIVEATNAAYDEGCFNDARLLLLKLSAIEPLSPIMVNLSGLIALRQGQLNEAELAFDSLLENGETDPSVRFNRAWVHALKNEHQDVLDLLDDEAMASSARAPALKVQALHHLDSPEEALALGQDLLEMFPENDILLGALSVAAMDSDDYEAAKYYAEKAKSGHDAWTTQGLIALNDNNSETALNLFDQALNENPKAPRAWLGKGLGLLAAGDADAAVPCLEKGAEIFEDHLGSWVALGWTHFIRKDITAARKAFDEAMRHDDNFAETHGALAVIDIAENKIDQARRRTDIALRLDKNCFGGILARALLLQIESKPEIAAKIIDRAMQMPIGVDGKTLAQSMIGLGLSKNVKND